VGVGVWFLFAMAGEGHCGHFLLPLWPLFLSLRALRLLSFYPLRSPCHSEGAKRPKNLTAQGRLRVAISEKSPLP